MSRFRLTREDVLSWPLAPVLLIAAGLLLAGVPEDFAGEDFEGPSLLTFGDGHALQLTNVLAIVLLLSGVAGLLWGGLRRAGELSAAALRQPRLTAALSLALLAGMAMLLLSGVSTALSWWAPGTLLAVTALLGFSAMLR